MTQLSGGNGSPPSRLPHTHTVPHFRPLSYSSLAAKRPLLPGPQGLACRTSSSVVCAKHLLSFRGSELGNVLARGCPRAQPPDKDPSPESPVGSQVVTARLWPHLAVGCALRGESDPAQRGSGLRKPAPDSSHSACSFHLRLGSVSSSHHCSTSRL
ncbi:unnamed protein product [Rangifer tarandus platyrhynchus]|uniref:Uncharacterized protein n=1 Tax=Rangifer tarandus platyrhynchus TaxID=3082113 RepID=A0AC60A5H2_RANTA